MFLTLLLRRRLAVPLAALALSASSAAVAQETVKIIVPFAGGSSTDAFARQVTQSLHDVTGNNYVVINKPGASGIIGSTEVNRAPPDGGTLLFTTGGHATNAVLFDKLPYDSLNGFTPVSELAYTDGFVLMVPAQSPYKTLEQLLSAARANPGKITYGSAGIGNTTHLVGALFEKGTGTKLIHVPYKSGPMTDLLAGQIDLIFWNPTASTPMIKLGKARALAVTSDKRLGDLPDVPTLKEKGIRIAEVPAWVGVFGPPGMSPDVARRIQRDLAIAMQKPEMQPLYKVAGTIPVNSTPAQFREKLTREINHLRRDVTPLGIRID